MSEQEQEQEEDRADRLSRRRKGRGESDTDTTTDDIDETVNTVSTDKTDNTDQPGNTSDTSESVGLTETKKTQVMHLSETDHKELHRVYQELQMDYEYEFEGDFELNRHFFPLLLRHGLPALRDFDAEEIREKLVELTEG